MNEERFDAVRRTQAKAKAPDPLTRRYIECLEAIANAAWDVYQNVPHASRPGEMGRLALQGLFAALREVDFLVEEEEDPDESI